MLLMLSKLPALSSDTEGAWRVLRLAYKFYHTGFAQHPSGAGYRSVFRTGGISNSTQELARLERPRRFAAGEVLLNAEIAMFCHR